MPATGRSTRGFLRTSVTSAIRNVTQQPWLTTLAPILISFSRRLVATTASPFGRERFVAQVLITPADAHEGDAVPASSKSPNFP